jgi:long-chain acyl-CoA synthetase
MIIQPMARRTLIDVFQDFALVDSEFIVHDDGYRTRRWTYAQVAGAARSFAGRLESAGIGVDQKVVIWGENSPEWIAVLWGCLLQGVVAVPIDYRSQPDLVLRISDIVQASAIVIGETVPSPPTTRRVWQMRTVAGQQSPPVMPASSPARTPDSVAEIIFTSGATADPKGVVLTHKNILANIIPIEREIGKYRRYLRLVGPIRFLNLLPMSHMFGQALATFIPPILPGIVVFSRSLLPHDIVRQIRERRVSVAVCVPKVMDVLRDHVLAEMPGLVIERPHPHPLVRWWRYRAVHRMFGFKFWAFVVGAAPLDPELEAFWRGLGFVVVQGYGLTETAPVVTLNHPLGGVTGAVGKPMPGVEIRIAEDGEILVRGDNVTTGYYNAPAETREAFKDGWFHTGDIGELDAGGHLRIRGRKKEMIVTPDGLNVYPDDVERVLNGLAGVRESAVVGAPIGNASGERVHAVIVLEEGNDLDAVVRQANAVLADHQRIRGAALWTAGELPRTDGTRKLRRRELKAWLTGQTAASRPAGASGAAQVVERFAPGRELAPDTTIEALGLSSLERIELMMALEEKFQVTVDETSFAAAQTIRDLDVLVRPLDVTQPGSAKLLPHPVDDFPAWNRGRPARFVRRISLPTWILPPMRLFVRTQVRGLEHLQPLDGPVIFAANHQSHLDTAAILDALPRRWRYRVAPAMLKEFFAAHFHPEQFTFRQRLTSSTNYYLAALFFNAFPLPQREIGAREALRHIGGIVDQGDSILIFPEGKRTDHGEIIHFQPGVGMIAARLGLPVVPIRLSGLDRILHHTWTRPRKGRAEVVFGPPMWLAGNDYAQLAAQVEAAVRHLEVTS